MPYLIHEKNYLIFENTKLWCKWIYIFLNFTYYKMSTIALLKNYYQNIESSDFFDMRDDFINIFLLQCGQLKFEDIGKKIYTSNSFNKLINRTLLNRSQVDDKSIIGCLLLIPYFMFKDGYSQYLASIIALDRWNTEVNMFTQVINETELKNLIVKIFLYFDKTKGFSV